MSARFVYFVGKGRLHYEQTTPSGGNKVLDLEFDVNVGKVQGQLPTSPPKP